MQSVDSRHLLTFELNDEDSDYGGRIEEIRKWMKEESIHYGATADVKVEVDKHGQLLFDTCFPKGFNMHKGQHKELLMKILKKVLPTCEQDESTMEDMKYVVYFNDDWKGAPLKNIMAEYDVEIGPDDDFIVGGS